MGMHKFSVIVPTYKRPEKLRACLNSLVRQDYPKDHYEVIVVDNSGEDQSHDVVTIFSSLIDMQYVRETRCGLVYARHAGAKAARHEVLAFTDDDGIVVPVWLSRIDEVLSTNQRIAAVAGRIEIRWDKEPPVWVEEYESLMGKLDYGDDIKVETGMYINGGNFTIKKSILFSLKGFNPDQVKDRLVGDGDTGLCRKLFKMNALIGWAPEALMYHCQEVERNATFKDIARRYKNNGIASAYNVYVTEGKRGIALIGELCLSFWAILKDFFGVFMYIFGEKRDFIFNAHYHLSKIMFIFRLVFDSDLTQMLKKRDWELT